MNPASRAKPSHASSVVELRIPPEAEWVAVARLAVAAVASRLRFFRRRHRRRQIGRRRSMHASRSSTARRTASIEIVCEAQRRGVSCVTVRDRGKARRLERVEEERIGEAADRRRLGVFLIRSLMDERRVYDVDAETGRELVMTKRVSG